MDRSTHLLETAFDSVPDRLMVIDRDYSLVMVNKAVRDLLDGVDPADGRTKCYAISHHRDSPCESAEHPCPLTQVARTGEVVTATHRHYDAAGNELFSDIVAAPIFGGDGQVAGIIESCRDVSTSKQKVAALERTVGELREALAQVRRLSGLLTICAWCRRIRDDQGHWLQMEDYVREHSEARFTHTICPKCRGSVR